MSIRVLIVDDSAFMRVFLSKLLMQDPLLEVVGTARNGRDAVAQVRKLHPDVVTMDIEMPELNGIDALKSIMRECPTPVIMLSSHTRQGAETTLDGLKYGAFDFVTKPENAYKANLDSVGAELLAKVKSAAKTQVQYLAPPSSAAAGPQSPAGSASSDPVAPLRGPAGPTAGTDKQVRQIVAIGTSTGGPRALETVLTSLPATIDCPLLIVQHMPPNFTKSLADRLNKICKIAVVEATHQQLVEKGVAYIAPGGFHMGVVFRNGQYRIDLNEQPKRNEHRPSVDVLFESVAELEGVKKHYVLMTGMGNDGAQGMLMGKQRGAVSTMAESQQTCVVYGMPKAAIELNCVDRVAPLSGIAAKIMEQLQRNS
ncbi:MAG: protein-glutamate methylesterase/protein-glutamine glutaminase [Bacilli bacterium]